MRSVDPAHAAYAARAAEYAQALGRIEHTAAVDRELVEAWARGVDGRIADVGAGPGQWTNWLAELGLDVEGIEPVREFIDSARSNYQGVRYRWGTAEDLGVAAGTLGGVLAWYSLIHTDPERIREPLDEFARAIRPGGGLALGFFAGDELRAFDHAVVRAWYWPVQWLIAHVEEAGFLVTRTETRTDPGARMHGALLAVRDEKPASSSADSLR